MHRRGARVGVLLGLFGLIGLIAGTGLPAAASSAVSQAPLVRTRPALGHISVSPNWSGYAAVLQIAGKVTYVSANWTVPSVKPINGASSTWVGIDGDGNLDLIQTGTEQDYSNGQFTYRAWWEILPAGETLIPSIVVHPGDEMFGSVQDISGTWWRITLKDVTTGKSFSIGKNYTGPAQTMEWIQEAPFLNGVETLAHYSTTEFSNLTAGVNFGAAGNPGIKSAEAIALRQNGRTVSTPSLPNGAGNAFRVAYGSVRPPAP